MLKTIILLIVLLSCACIVAEDTIPFSKQEIELNSGLMSSRSLDNVAFRQIISIPDAQWLRVHFSEYNLGAKSYVKITSLKDHAEQILDGKNLEMWHNSSAYFNGSRVLVELYVSPQDTDVFITCQEISAGEKGASDRSICGSSDDRKASNDKRSGRLVPVGCTGWIIGNGYLTAGHCVDGHSVELLEFNVPASDADGSINHPAPEHQYPVLGTVQYKNGGQGRDWCTFKVGANSVTGLTPLQAQKAFFKVANDITPEQIRITGYGVDNMPRGSSGNRNKDSQTQQTHVGPFSQLSNNTLRYETDTTGGNSGSPVISETHQTTVGIHTHGGCGSWGGSNAGTSFKNSNLSKAIQLLSENAVFVDNSHPSTTQNGDIFSPYHSISEAVAKNQDKSINIAPGVYQENVVISKNVTIHVITDVATIGQQLENVKAQVLNSTMSGDKEINAEAIELGKNFAIAKGANIVISAKSVTIGSDLHIPAGASLTINVE